MKIKICLIIVLFITIFTFLNRLVVPKYQDDLIEGHMIKEYYNEEKNHEVIFIGDCEVYANFSPMILYKDYGITSYIRGTSQQLIWQSYEILKETIKYEKPKVIIFNVNSMRYDKPVSEAYNRLTIDNMKWSKEKINIIKSSMMEEENFISYIIPLLRYHSRITELTSEDIQYFFKEKNVTHNGFIINKNIKPYTSFPTERKLPSYTFSKENFDYLTKMYELCKDNNITFILIKAPSIYPYWYDEYDKQIKEFANNNKIDYYNLKENINEIGIDFSKDTYDGGIHLNLTGATKLSKYFGNILSEKYNLTDYRLNNSVNSIYEEKILLYNKSIEME